MKAREPATALPAPAADAAAHSDRVRRALIERIEAEGPLRFDRYWEQVLYAPGLGYYTAGPIKLGAEGDFVTAPELGPVFARCCAATFEAVLSALGGGDVLELGAGTGAFAADVLLRLAERGALPERYLVLERSAELAARQRATLAERAPDLAGRVTWLEALPARSWRGVVFANEVLDVLAPRRVLWRAGGWYELHVGLDAEGEFRWHHAPLPEALAPAVARLPRFWERPPAGDWITELQPALDPWVAGVVAQLGAGALLLSDYGYAEREYYHPERVDGTLIAHYRHRALADPFLHPGLVDLSVSVNFGQVARAIEGAGLEPAGCVSQATFLLETCLAAEAEAALDLPAGERLARMNEIRRLTLPAQMGERFRFIAGVRGVPLPLPGLPPGSWLTI